ncbi:tubulin-tyrosine ligase family-domain-containing protein [Obelidium mucronatum]|nr:tubulin-tyrosine ligase family-domain-containing protein [Obelidium mucronatum]
MLHSNSLGSIANSSSFQSSATSLAESNTTQSLYVFPQQSTRQTIDQQQKDSKDSSTTTTTTTTSDNKSPTASSTTLHIRQRTPSTTPGAGGGGGGSGGGGGGNPTIRFKTHLRNTVLDVFKDRGWKETDSETDWDFHWADVHWVHEMFDHMYLAESQRINHFRNHYELTRKDLLVKNMKRMIKTMEKEYGKAEGAKFDFICTSYVLPQEHALFQEEFKRNPGSVWIMKPVGKAQGKGIFLINKMSQINQWRTKNGATGGSGSNNNSGSNNSINSSSIAGSRANMVGGGAGAGAGGGNAATTTSGKETGGGSDADIPEAYIVQRYIENPYLIGGKKFDLRIYVLVTSYSPLVVHIHRNGFCRFSNHQFTMNVKDISNLYIHATNVAIQKHSPNYDSDKGCKWLLRNLKTFLISKHGAQAVNTLFTDMEALVVRSLLSVQKVMIHDKHCFELYGYDILIDTNLKPWLLEVNASPSLTAETQFDYDLKHQMLNDAFDVLDLEKRFSAPSFIFNTSLLQLNTHPYNRFVTADKKPRTKVGGFDLVYNDGPVKQERTIHYSSYLGCHHPIIRAPRVKKRLAAKTGAASRVANNDEEEEEEEE